MIGASHRHPLLLIGVLRDQRLTPHSACRNQGKDMPSLRTRT